MKVLIINRQQVKELLPMRACMKVLANTFRVYSRGEAVQPLRTMMKVPDSGGILAQVAGHDLEIIKLIPPLVINESDVGRFLEAFEAVLERSHRFPGPIWEFTTRLAKHALKR